MPGLGTPCGACKFLRRKCVSGCVFAPYFSHEQGASHFAAIHKVFGASNVSKLMMHLPEPNRSEAAVTISYEAQARLQDPIYGCVAHIFALQQQVVILQAQIASMKAHAAQNFVNGSTTAISTPQEDKLGRFPPYQQDGQEYLLAEDARMMQQFTMNPSMSPQEVSELYYDNGLQAESYCIHSSQKPMISFGLNDNSSCSMASLGIQINTRTSANQDMDELTSAAFTYLHHT